MRVVITGGTGLVGRHLCAALVADGHEAVVLTRDVRRASGRLPSPVRSVAWDPALGTGAWTEAIRRADAVVNLAGESLGSWPWTAPRKRLLRDSRLLATGTLIQAIASLAPDDRPRVLVSASGTDVYDGLDVVPATEHTPPADTFLARLCADWEREAERARPLGVRVVTARLAPVLARDAPALQRIALPVRCFVGGRVGSGEQWVGWVHVDDAVRLLVRAIQRDALSGALNVAAPDVRPQRDFVRAVAAALRRPAVVPTPAWMVRLALGEQAVLVLGSRRAWPARALEDGYSFRYAALEDALGSVLARERPARRRDESKGSYSSS